MNNYRIHHETTDRKCKLYSGSATSAGKMNRRPGVKDRIARGGALFDPEFRRAVAEGAKGFWEKRGVVEP